MIKKLRWKFIMINMLIISVVLLIGMGIVYWSTGNDMKQKSISMMESILENPYKLEIIEGHSEEIRLPYFAVLLNQQHEVEDIIGGYYDLSDQMYLEEMIQAVISSGKRTDELHEIGLRYLYQDTPESSSIAFADLSSETLVLSGLLNTCIRLYILGFAVFFGISVLLARWAVRPVETAWIQQKQFVADASHELKTPLTVITTNAEMLEQGNCSEQEIRTFSANILQMSQQMKILLERMIELAKGDTETKPEFSRIDLSRLIMEEILSYEAVFFENELELKDEIEENIMVKGDQTQLRQIMDILLDNALKYADRPGKVKISLEQYHKKFCMLKVSNTGKALSPEQTKLIFQRFYRTDHAHTQKGSFGLGLAIAQNIVEHHKGEIRAESADGMNTFLVKLPLI